MSSVIRTVLVRDFFRTGVELDSEGCGPYGISLVYCMYGAHCNQARPIFYEVGLEILIRRVGRLVLARQKGCPAGSVKTRHRSPPGWNSGLGCAQHHGPRAEAGPVPVGGPEVRTGRGDYAGFQLPIGVTVNYAEDY
jgi:hypothetical protein